MISVVFPKTHPKAGQPTSFISKIFNQQKKHTIRNNYELWKKRIDEVNEGKAVLDLRFWEGKPYASKQQTFKTLKQSEVGIQKLSFFDSNIDCPYAYDPNGESNHPIYGIADLAINDGLLLPDFKAWFKGSKLSKPMAIIHFTKFRY